MVQRLIYNVTGQVLRHVPATRQASATWVLEDLLRSTTDAARTLDSGAATLDAATEPTLAIAGPTQANARLIDVASTSGFVVGTTYEIVNGDTGEGEYFELGGIDTDDTLYVKHPLAGTYPIGSTVRGVELVTAAISAAVVQDEQRMQGDWPMRVVWTYTGGRHDQEQVRLVRHADGDLDAAAIERDVRDLFPDVDTRMAHHGRPTLGSHVRIVIRQTRSDLASSSIKIEQFLGGEQLHWAVVWRVLWHLARMGNAPGTGDVASWATYCKDEHTRFWNELTVGEAGPEVVELEPVTDTTGSSDSTEYRKRISEL